MRCFVQRRRMVKSVERNYLNRSGDHRCYGGGRKRPSHSGRLLYQQAEKRDEYVHRESGGRRSDGRRRCPTVQRNLGGL